MPHPLTPRSYQFGITNTDRWQQFPARDDDIFVITPAKCGTTWMQTIVTFLVFGDSDLPFVPAERSPWFDCVLAPIEETLETLNQDAERNVIKTHTPLDGVPFSETGQYIGVYRDPRDAFMSWLNHEQNMVINTADITQTADERFFAYVDQDYEPGQPDNCLAAMVHHLNCLWQLKELNNIHLFHYSDLKHNLSSEMTRVAKAIGVKRTANEIEQLAEAATFESMHQNHERFVPGGKKGFWHEPQKFLNKGSNGQWRDQISDYSLQHFSHRLSELTTPEMANWLVDGALTKTN